MANLVDYTNVNWKDYPNTDTPVTATNLNIMDSGIKNNATAINELNSIKAALSHTHTKSQITDFPALATVATSGSYSDLKDKPTIPTDTNQLTNGAGYITSAGTCTAATYAQILQTYSASGESFGTDFPLTCKHNAFGDNSFGLMIGDGSTYGVTVGSARRVLMNSGNAQLTASEGVCAHSNNGLYSQGYSDETFKPCYASAFSVQSSRKVKDNILNMTNTEAFKILELSPVSFNYKKNFGDPTKNNYGLIAEEVAEIIPECVDIPDDYDESEFDEENKKLQPIPSIDYSKLVPHLIKMVQIQQKQIEELEARVKALEAK